jgi:hypothetical protein
LKSPDVSGDIGAVLADRVDDLGGVYQLCAQCRQDDALRCR